MEDVDKWYQMIDWFGNMIHRQILLIVLWYARGKLRFEPSDRTVNKILAHSDIVVRFKLFLD